MHNNISLRQESWMDSKDQWEETEYLDSPRVSHHNKLQKVRINYNLADTTLSSDQC